MNGLLTPQQLAQICHYLRATGCIPKGGGGGSAFVGKGGVCTYPVRIVFDARGRIIDCESGGDPPELNCVNTLLVAPDATGGTFTSIQDAIDFAIASGADPDNPAKILVCPGEYAESVEILQPGISVVALAQNEQFQFQTLPSGQGHTRITGGLNFFLGAAASLEETTAAWEGIDVGGLTEQVGPNASFVYIRNCRLLGGLNAEGANASSELVVENCTINRTGSTTINAATQATRLVNCEVINDGTQPQIVSASGTFAADNCNFSGGRIESITTVTLNECTVSNSVEHALELVSPSIATCTDCRFNVPTGNIVTGTGTFIHDNLTLLNAFGLINQVLPAGLTQKTNEAIPNEQFVRPNKTNGFEITTETAITVNGNGTYTLPSLSDEARAGPIVIIPSAGFVINAFTATIAAQGGDTISMDSAIGAGSVTLPPRGAVFYGDSQNDIWIAVSLGARNCLNAFLVSPNGGGGAHLTIGDAYAAAKAAGRGISNRAEILVCPGVYTENLTLDTAGIDIIGVSPSDNNEQRTLSNVLTGPTVLNGTLTVNFGAGGSANARFAAWRGINIDTDLGTLGQIALIFTGSNFQELFMSDCEIRSGGNQECVAADNSGAGDLTDSTLDLIRVGIQQTAVSSQDAILLSDGRMILADCRVISGSASAVVTSAGSTFEARDTVFSQGHDIAGNATYTRCETLESLTCNGTVILEGCELGANAIDGTGTLTYDWFTYAGSRPDFDKTGGLTVTQREALAGCSKYITVGPTAGTINLDMTTVENVLVDDSGAGTINVRLPKATDRLGPVRLKTTGDAISTVNLVVATGSGDTINGGGGATISATGITLCSDGVSDWQTWG